MNSNPKNRKKLLSEIIEAIETSFRGSIVVWTGTGCPDDEYDDTEIMEAYMIKDKDYVRFEDFVWELEEKVAEPNGFSVMIHGLSPTATRKHRWSRFLSESKKRMSEDIIEDFPKIKERNKELTEVWITPLAFTVGDKRIYCDTPLVEPSKVKSIPYTNGSANGQTAPGDALYWTPGGMQSLTLSVKTQRKQGAILSQNQIDNLYKYQPENKEPSKMNGEYQHQGIAA